MELLIVIVVIAVLAGITAVSFTGIQARASETAAKADLTQLARQVQLYKVSNGTTPRGTAQLSTMGVRLSRSAHDWINLAQDGKFVICHPTDTDDWAVVTISSSGSRLNVSNSSGIATWSGANSHRVQICGAAGVTLPANDIANATYLYQSGAWQSWVGGT